MVAHFGHHVVGAMLNPLLPMIRTDLNLNYTTAGVAVSVFSITGGVAQLPAGWLADRIDPQPVILISVSGVALGGLLIGLSGPPPLLTVHQCRHYNHCVATARGYRRHGNGRKSEYTRLCRESPQRLL